MSEDNFGVVSLLLPLHKLQVLDLGCQACTVSVFICQATSLAQSLTPSLVPAGIREEWMEL